LKLRYIYFFFSILLTAVIIKVNFSYYGISSSGKNSHGDEKEERLRQLNYLKHELHSNNSDVKMQKIFPEGYIFCNVLYGLSWCEFAEKDSNPEIKKTAIAEAKYALKRTELPAAIKTFNKNCSPEYGIFYQGWCNYLRAKLLLLSGENSGIDKKKFNKTCYKIAHAIDSLQTPFPESYINASWPADVMPAVISLKIHDRLFKEQYKHTVELWLQKVKRKQDPETGLIPHSSEACSGSMLIPPRGSSQSLIIRLLAEIDTAYALQQYNIFKKLFLSEAAGLYYVKEFQNNKNGAADIDSGPVLFGAGAAATITAISTSSACGDYVTAQKLKRSVEAAGFPFSFNKKRLYIFGALPIADLFITWSQLTNSYVYVKPADEHENYTFFILSLLIIIGMDFPLIYKFYKKP
jgi:hypothetical protein